MPKFTKQQRKTIDKIYSTLKKAGFDDISIAGMLGNALSESSFNPDSVSKSNYHGLWQNSKDLHNAIVGLYGNHNIDTQLQYVMDWVDGSEKVTKGKYRDWLAMGAGKYKKQGYKSATDAADAFMKLYERPVILDKSGNIVGYQKDRERKDNAAVMYDYINSTYSNAPSPNGNRVMKFDKEFWNTPEELTPYNQTPELVKYWMNYKDPTQYPIINKTPQYLSSTNAADAPNGRITGPSLIRDIHNQDIMNREAVRDAFERGATVWGNKNYLPSLSEVMQDNVKDYAKDIMFANPFYGSEIEYKPLKYKDGKDLPKFGDGKRMLYDDQTGQWNRVTDDPYADVFSNFSTSPNGTNKENNAKSHYETDNSENAVRLRDKLSKLPQFPNKVGEKPIEEGLKQPLFDPFMAAFTGGRLAGDIVGDIVGDATSRLAGKVTPVLYKGLNDLYLKSLEKQASSISSSNKPFFVFHGTNRRHVLSEDLHNYSEKDVGLHVSRDKRVAEGFTKYTSPYGSIHEGIDYGIYPDALYGDFGRWHAYSWNKRLNDAPTSGFIDTGTRAARDPDISLLDAASSARDLIKEFDLDPSIIRAYSEAMGDPRRFGYSSVSDVNKEFADYLKEHHVNFEYLNAAEGSAKRASKYPSIFLSDPSDVKFAKKIYVTPEIPNSLPSTAYIDRKTGKLKFPDMEDTYPVNERFEEDVRLFDSNQRDETPRMLGYPGSDFDVDNIKPFPPVPSAKMPPLPFPPPKPIYDIAKDPYIGTFKCGKDLSGFYKGKTPRTTSGGYAPTPMSNITATPDNEASRMLENHADLIPFVGSVRDWESVADGDISNIPSAGISTVADLFLPALFKSYRGIGALKRLAQSSVPKTSAAIKSAYNTSRKAVKDFKDALAWQLAGAYEDALQYYNNTLK